MEDDEQHARYLSQLFNQQQYFKVGKRPLFIIYRPNHLPDAAGTIEIIKKTVLKETGYEPFILANNNVISRNPALLQKGFDAIFSFRPALGSLPAAFKDGFSLKRYTYNALQHRVNSGRLKIYDYKEAVLKMRELEGADFTDTCPVVFVGWDNTARRGKKGIIIKDAFPELFKEELQRVVNKLSNTQRSPRILFLNAWNEWAEGNHLEPCMKYGHGYLDAVKEVLSGLT